MKIHFQSLIDVVDPLVLRASRFRWARAASFKT